jgi:putative hydroxymethylpyrimidine transport system substrate-binding protein
LRTYYIAGGFAAIVIVRQAFQGGPKLGNAVIATRKPASFLLCLFLLALHSAPASASDRLTIILDWSANANHPVLFAAKYCGAFLHAGWDVERLAPADPESPPRPVAAGQADLAVTYRTQLTSMDDHGLPLVRIGTLVDTTPSAILALGDSGVHSLADLMGRRIGVFAGGVQEALLDTMLRQAHPGLADVSRVKVNFQKLPPLMSRRLDAVMGLSVIARTSRRGGWA